MDDAFTQGSRVIVDETIPDIGGLAGGRVTSIMIMIMPWQNVNLFPHHMYVA